MKKYANNLYLLSFIDIVDRVDILLLEIRHLQQSIIDSLHAPTLFLPLRHEEKTIFGDWVYTEYKNRAKKGIIQAAEIAQQHIIRYPSPRRAIQHLTKDPHDDPLKEALLARVGEIWSGDLWARGERRHYHALLSLQILKQQVFRDKLVCFIEAHQARIINPHVTKKGTLQKPALMILRRAIIARINRYITIGNL